MLHIKHTIILWGMPGSGKSKLGKKLGKHLGFTHIDLDEYIVTFKGKSVTEIFETEGEKAFRVLERELLLEIINDFQEPKVISVGGGTPFWFENITIMINNALTVYLEVPIEILISRLKDKTDRPLLANNLEKNIQFLFANRKRGYELADVKVSHHPDQWRNLKTQIDLWKDS